MRCQGGIFSIYYYNLFCIVSRESLVKPLKIGITSTSSFTSFVDVPAFSR